MSSNASTDETEERRQTAFLSRIFSSCESDPKGSVHRAWGVSLIFLVVYFVATVVEMINIQSSGGSKALVLASLWTGLQHLVLAILGTFVLKRFPTSFAIGFFLGFLVVTANQNLILFAVFSGFSFGNPKTNHVFSTLAFCLFVILAFFAVLLVNFRKNLIVAAVDAKGIGRKRQINNSEISPFHDDQ